MRQCRLGGSNHSHATQDLFDNIAQGNYPEWTLYIQTMDPAQVCFRPPCSAVSLPDGPLHFTGTHRLHTQHSQSYGNHGLQPHQQHAQKTTPGNQIVAVDIGVTWLAAGARLRC